MGNAGVVQGFPRLRRLWEIEPQVIALMRPPLYSAGNAGHPFYERVRAARAAFRTAARGAVPKGG